MLRRVSGNWSNHRLLCLSVYCLSLHTYWKDASELRIPSFMHGPAGAMLNPKPSTLLSLEKRAGVLLTDHGCTRSPQRSKCFGQHH
jgi:hypothetical protein